MDSNLQAICQQFRTDNLIKKKELDKWFNCLMEFDNNPSVPDYNKDYTPVILAMVGHIVNSKYGPTDDFSIEKLYKEFVSKVLVDDDKRTKIEKIVDVCNKFKKEQ